MPSKTIPVVQLPGTKLHVSKFIFGTASLFNVGSSAKRIELLEAAVQAGFTHFDTAPYYGFGWAERDLGEIVNRHPHVSVTTKVGIYSPSGESASRSSVFFRKVAGRLIPSLSKPTIDFSLGRARTMLEDSLQRLRSTHIEIYMLHEPELHMVATDEWQRWLETEVKRGRIGTYGLAVTKEQLTPFLGAKPTFGQVIQMLDSLDGCEADCLLDNGRPMQITYGYVSAARSNGNDHTPVENILRQAALRNRSGAIIVSTTKKSRLHQYSGLLK